MNSRAKRMRRGFHRIGLAVALPLAIGALAMAVWAFYSYINMKDFVAISPYQQTYFDTLNEAEQRSYLVAVQWQDVTFGLWFTAGLAAVALFAYIVVRGIAWIATGFMDE